ncbi:ABC transporter permease [Halobacterium wangiae]|uniref:ABC transporter permease n=1 Tax=Halobacterium wangiae TaxID=2902623 RepID=UPI001E49AFC5|nr:ABC transporter permease [Halobacterium wangiae]
MSGLASGAARRAGVAAAGSLAGLVAIFAVVTLAGIDPVTFGVQVLNGLTLGGIYVLIAIGLSLIFGVMNVVNFAHGSLWMLGAYLAFAVVGASVTVPGFGVIAGSFWLALLVAPLLVGAVGFGIEYATFRPLYGRNPLYHILLTFGFTLVFVDVVEYFWGSGFNSVAPPELFLGAIQLGPAYFPKYRLFVLGAALGLSGLVWVVLKFTNFGLIVRAGSQNRQMARSLGINVTWYYTGVFVLGAALAGVAGALSAPLFPIVPSMWTRAIILAFIVVIVGGLGSFRGAVVAGLGVGVVESLGSTYLPEFSGYLVYILMFTVLLVRPYGIFGREESVEAAETNVEIDRALPTIGAKSPIFLGALALFAVFPFLTQTFLSSYYLGVMVQALALATLVLGLDLVTGYTGLISFGHAMFIGLGAYVTALVLVNVTGLLPVAILVAVVVTALLAWAVGFLGVRVGGVYFAMLTLAVAQIVHQMVFDFPSLTGSNDGLGFALPPVPFLNLGDTTTLYYVSLLTLAALYLLAVRVLRSPFGTSLVAIRDSEHRMEALGYDVDKYKRRAFMLSGAYGGIGGVLYAMYFTFVDPTVLKWTVSGDAIVMMVLGGMGTLYGPIVGAIAFVFLRNGLSIYVSHWEFVAGAIFIFAVIFMPRGLVSLPFDALRGDGAGGSSTEEPPEPAANPQSGGDGDVE